MGALTIPMFFHGVPVASGDVVVLEPRGVFAWFRRSFAAIVDLRDRSIPYLVRRVGDRVFKIPLDGAPYPESRHRLTVYRLPGIDKATASTIAARAAERPGEGVHHPSYDCGREFESDEEFVRDAYRAAGVELTFESGRPGAPLEPVRGPQDPPNSVVTAMSDDEIAAARRDGRLAAAEAERLLGRGIEKTLPWQRRSKR